MNVVEREFQDYGVFKVERFLAITGTGNFVRVAGINSLEELD